MNSSDDPDPDSLDPAPRVRSGRTPLPALGLLTLLLGAALLPACSLGSRTVGTPLAASGESVRHLEVGLTTRNDVLALFGAPTDIRGTHDGDVMRYLYSETEESAIDVGLSALWGLFSISLFRSESDREATENLTLFFSEAGKLMGYSYTPIPRLEL